MAGNSSDLAEFGSRWNLDAAAVNFIASLDLETQNTVIAEFAPRESTHDVLGKLKAFARSVQEQREALSSMSLEMDAFATKWGLDSSARAWLAGLPTHVTDVIAEEFDPKEDTRNIFGKLRGFARSIQASRPPPPRAIAPALDATGHGCSSAAQRSEEHLLADLGHFAAKWALDAENTDWLYTLPAEVASVLLDEFDPKDGTRDVVGKLRGFARSVQARRPGVRSGDTFSAAAADHGAFIHPGVAPAPARTSDNLSAEIDDFALRWALDHETMSWVRELPTEVSTILIDQFDPKEDTQDVIGKMRGFARSILARRQSSGDTAVGGSLSQRLAAFAAHWRIDESTRAMLSAMPPDVQATVIEEFVPKDDVVNVSGKLCAFARSITAGRRGRDALEAFLDFWSVDEETRHFLRGLPREATEKVIHDFDPAPGTRDVSGKLRMFARGVLANKPHVTSSGRGPPPPPEEWRGGGAGLHGTQCGGGGFGSRGHAEAMRTPRLYDEHPAAAYAAAIQAFIARWALDASAADLLGELAEGARAKVLEQFEPRGDTRNVMAKLRAFANTVASGQGRRASAETHVPPAFTHQGMPPVGGSYAQGAGGARGLSGDDMAFLARWGLENEQKAVEVLLGLQPTVRARLMQEFAPGHGTHNVLGKFCGFARSVAGASAAGRAPPPSAGGGSFARWQPPSGAALPPLRAPASFGGGGGRPGYSGSFGGGGSSGSGGFAGGGEADAERAAARWGLDEGARALLRGLNPEARATVIAEFQPRSDVRDTSGKFCAFARSVATRLIAGPGLKRPPPPGYGAPPPQRRRL